MNALITGTGRGIGRAIAQTFLAAGHAVVGIDLLEAPFDQKGYTHVRGDIAKMQLPRLDTLDVLINNAGVQESGKDIEINLMATMRVTEYYIGLRPKSVVFLASASASSGAEFPAYAASKGGVVAYMKNVALRMAEWGGTANSISPGGVTTELNRHVTDDPALWQKVMDETPLKKWATPEEIAEWVYFVACVNRSMTAQDLLIDNGEQARANFIW